ncbi:MAG: ROK family transcriptional regulator [Propionicimonas sp.]|uniref:ROK family transcriptional regulator n=1 Tax=Propionicimonas sp. TaxID=1955623 RepID=UPI002B1FA680|nr:ROK family transcriptional regulator [Propionicimonas sp.]MEA4945456.1 ROK family transcriptional regulator [Propionicimonas sp.]MEA5054675.1 ROK family transcriptional regulator [Propionicimonas sp.]
MAGPNGYHLISSRGDASDVLRVLLDGSEWTRADLAQNLSLSRSTISTRIDALRQAGLIRDASRVEPRGGRPQTKIALNERALTVAAIELGHKSGRVTIGDLAARPIDRVSFPLDTADSVEQTLRSASARLRGLLSGPGSEAGPLAGVTLGLPFWTALGAMNTRERAAHWLSFPVEKWLGDKLDAEVFIANDVNLMTLGEQMEQHPNVRDLMFLYAGDGIGLGIVASGELVRGSNDQAGEITHLPVPRDTDEICECGLTGCLGAVATLPRLAARLRADGVEVANSEDLPVLAASGNAQAGQLLRQAGRDAGDVLAYLIAATNPSLLVVGGEAVSAGDHYLTGVKEALFRRGAPPLTKDLHVVRSASSPDSGTVGALRLAAEQVLNSDRLFRLLAGDAGPDNGNAVGNSR